MNIFNDNKSFYPTPKKLIDKMLDGIKWSYVKSVLEPSAGKGDLVEKVLSNSIYTYEMRGKRYSDSKTYDIDCIEIDESLQLVLKGKGYRVVHNNFLTYNTYKKYDLILMNPPFDNGCKHLLKALQMQKDGGSIVCLLNAETLRNAYSNERKELVESLEKHGASIEYLKDEFLTAERKTAVEIALIKVVIQEKSKSIEEDDFLDKFMKSKPTNYNDDETEQEMTLATYTKNNHFIEDAVEKYNFEIAKGLKIIDMFNSFKSLSLNLRIYDSVYGNYSDADKSVFIKEVRRAYWKELFYNDKFTASLTYNLKEDLYKRIELLRDYDFSVFNIFQLLEDMNKKINSGIEQTILDLFKELAGKYSLNEKNIHYYDGWATNKSYYIGTKVIAPYINDRDKISDIYKVLTFFNTGGTTIVNAKLIIQEKYTKENTPYPNNYFDREKNTLHTDYFSAKFHKKGTTHITFNDLELLNRFNLWVGIRNKDLPPYYGRKAYSDMSSKEKDLVKEFSKSEENYNKIYNNQAEYLIDFSNQKTLSYEG